jgi:hypothetical protein
MKLKEVDFSPLQRPVSWRDARIMGEKLTFGEPAINRIVSKIALGLLVAVALSPICVVLIFAPEPTITALQYVWLLCYIVLVWLALCVYYLYIIARGRTYLVVLRFGAINGFHGGGQAGEIGLIKYFTDTYLKESLFVLTGELDSFAFETCHWKLYRKRRQGRDVRSDSWQTIRLALDRKLPHMIFDNKLNNWGPVTSLPVRYAKSQIDTFEGDLHKYYKIYAPDGYGTDIRTIFTPEVLWQIRTLAKYKLDIEIVDNWLILYQKNGSYTKALQPLLTCAAVLAAEIQQEASNYKDDRSLIAGVMAKQGRRLRPSFGFFVFHACAAAALYGIVASLRTFSWQVGLAVALFGGVQSYLITRKKFN